MRLICGRFSFVCTYKLRHIGQGRVTLTTRVTVRITARVTARVRVRGYCTLSFVSNYTLQHTPKLGLALSLSLSLN